MATNGSFSQQEQYKATPESYPATSGATEANSSAAGGQDLSKDEVGWYFVEQYYTTLSKNPEKLHLFYGKRSQFVSGQEAEVSAVAVGRSAIQERIKQLDFQDCKVRVSNVDSQASYDNIVIQVIGETSNKSADLKKFVQTFVLAQQPTGYFVLNDIFRYINEEGEEEQAENAQDESAAAPSTLVEDVEMPKAQPSTEDPVAPAVPTLDADVVDKKLEETVEEEKAAEETPTTNGTPAVEEEPVAAAEVQSAPEPEVAAKEVEEEIKEPEKPKDPLPTPAVTRAPSATKVPAPQPAAPPKPLSWASRAAAAVASNAPKPAVPVVTKTATPPAQSRAAPPAPQAAKPTPTPQAPATPNEKENVTPGSGWQTAGGDHTKRQNRPQSISSPPEKEGTMGYVRNVTDKVQTEDLRAALALHGPLIYFDINRSKNCAFVEYETPAGYQAAQAANPHQVCGESIFVELRRPKAGAYGGNGYPGGRGGLNNQRGGRGGFPQRGGRGGPGGQGGQGAPRGRGTGQSTNA